MFCSFDLEPVSVVPVFGKYYSANNIHPPLPAKSLLPHELQKLVDFASPQLPAPGAVETAVVSAPCATYPTISIQSPGFVLGAPLKSSSSPYSEIKADFAYRSGSRSAVIPCKEKDPNDLNSNSWTICTLPDNGKELTPSKDGEILIRLKGCGMYI